MDENEVPIYASEYGLSEPSIPESGDVREDPEPPVEEELEGAATYRSEYGLSQPSSDLGDGDAADPQAPRDPDEMEGTEMYKSESNHTQIHFMGRLQSSRMWK
jgi:hypothetical protein